ncbi:hypothetical protein B484DRAFT_444361, partial [Ochromonadaceae sp. CCMP2298]
TEPVRVSCLFTFTTSAADVIETCTCTSTVAELLREGSATVSVTCAVAAVARVLALRVRVAPTFPPTLPTPPTPTPPRSSGQEVLNKGDTVTHAQA